MSAFQAEAQVNPIAADLQALLTTVRSARLDWPDLFGLGGRIVPFPGFASNQRAAPILFVTCYLLRCLSGAFDVGRAV